MATRSNIAYRTVDGRIVSVYCHWDGYPENNGRILAEHYTDNDKIVELITLGGISSLRPEVGEKHGFSYRETDMTDEAFEAAYGNMTTFYCRDRGEELVVNIYNDIPSWIDEMEEYAYLWNGTEWLVNDHGRKSDNGFPVFDRVEDVLVDEDA
jgi:hypothetical protein